MDVKHSLDDLVRLGSEHGWAHTTADEGDGLDSLSSELLVAWLWVLVQARQEEVKSLSEMWVELSLDDNSCGSESGD